MSGSKLLLKVVVILFFVFTAGYSCDSTSPWGYTIYHADDAASEKWGIYLFKHLSNRSNKGERIVLWGEKKDNFKKIFVQVDPELSYDYCVENSNDQLIIKAKTEKTIIWLIYQTMSSLSVKDKRFVAGDLPPAIINIQNNYCANFDFTYREPLFSPNLDFEYAQIVGTNMLEKDWGIWGHNMKLALGSDTKNLVYAHQNNVLKMDQYCFSNEETFNLIDKYIFEHYKDGSEKSERFMIMPNDNNIVCNCDLCLQNGNTMENATPAVSALIQKLAKKYPKHLFFTSAYLTTMSAPKEQLPSNCGVMISTINLPKGVELTRQKEVDDFMNILNEWKKRVSNIYIWDYASNFDDYLTPVPVLYGLKKQLAFYKQMGVKGVFLNASGYDYAPFDDLKTYVAAALLMNTNLSIDDLTTSYFDHFYPTSGKKLKDYYLSLEKRLEKNNKPYNLYGGFPEALSLFLDIDEFIAFYNSLDALIAGAGEEEKMRLEKLSVALSYTRLQIAYNQGTKSGGFADINDDKSIVVKPEIRKVWNKLSLFKDYKNLSNYKETDGSLSFYLNSWKRIFDMSPYKSLLMDEELSFISKPDPEYKNVNVLNDGAFGFSEDYHQGWLLSSSDNLIVRFSSNNLTEAKKITVRFLLNDRHRIYRPERVELYKGDVMIRNLKPIQNDDSGIATYGADVDFSGSETYMLKAYRNNSYERGSIACDEIQVY